MTNFAGTLVSPYVVFRQSRTAPVPSFNAGALVPIGVFAPGARAAGNGIRIAAGTANRSGRVSKENTAGRDWFDRVHLIPRSRVDFGNVITSVFEEFELFNGHKVPVQILTITPNAGTGVDMVDPPTLPYTLPALTSLLDDSSAKLAPVLPQIEATADGAPIFDGSIDFEIDTTEEPSLLVRGFRIAFFPVEPESPYVERIQFKTDVLPRIDGSEQRLALRAFWRQFFDFTYLLTDADRRRLEELLFTYRARELALPLWHERTPLTVQAIAGATTCTVQGTADVDFREGGLAVIWESATKYDVVQVDTVTATTLEFTASPLLNTYDAGVIVMPVRTAVIDRTPGTSRYRNELQGFTLTFRVTENHTGAPTGSTSGWDTYSGKVLLDDGNVVEGETSSGSYEQRIFQIDPETGIVHTGSREEFSRRATAKGFHCGTRAEVLKLRRLLLALAGKQKTFYLPTFTEDLLPVVDIAASADTLDVENVGYTRFAQARAQRSVVRVTFTDGTSLTREITAAVEIDDEIERLTLNTTWPADRTVDEVDRVEFFELVRFNTDEFAIIHERVGLARLNAPVILSNG